MDFVLNHWDTLVNDTLNPDNEIAFTMDRETVCNLICQSASEQQLVRNRLITLVVAQGKVMDKYQLIHITQTMLIHMLDKLYRYQQHPKISADVKCLYNEVSLHLQNTLNFIEDFFCHYFNRNEKVPIVYLSNFREDTKKQLELLKKRMKEGKVDSKLTNIVVNHFFKFSAINELQVSYNEILYQKEVISALLADGHLQSEGKLMETLFYFNFNYLFQHNSVNYLFEIF